ncbi:unnamed protein product [Brassica napus]|uniref:ADP-ribosyl cyclase/cyclic ADP-ribose hydrolase n=1 Tax=Brassica napus TaxID=3708 RepID=A0A816J6M3_BRANA|nr:unnamed protein product [Brassica napus]
MDYRNWLYDVFPSFSGEDVRINFLSHFLKELDRKLIKAFKDNEIERSHSIAPALVTAIRTSRIAVVVFSPKYASSSWCLDELVEIVRCMEELGQLVLPIFYGLDPSHVRKQTGKFGEGFAKTCKMKTKAVKIRWQQALTVVANLLGYHSQNFNNEAKMIEVIVNDLLGKLNYTSSKDFEECVGIEDHIAEMSLLLDMESEEVRMIGIWGPSGIGKTTIARALFSRLSRRFQCSVFIDRRFISKIMEGYRGANPDDYNMKLSLQRHFLSEILGTRHTQIDHLGAVENRLKNQKVLISIDDLDDQVVLDVLAGQAHWFGSGSRIIVVTKDRHFLRAHGIDHIYEVCLPSEERALEILCRSAFRQNSPREGFEKLAVEVTRHAGSLPLGLTVLGSTLRGRDKAYWMDILPTLQSGVDEKIEKTLRISYDGLDREEDKVIYRHIACLFNGEKIPDIKLLLEDRNLGVIVGIQNLVDKSLIHVRSDTVEMHSLLQEIGRKIVRAQSIDEPGNREFLVDLDDICDVLGENSGTKKVLGVALDMDKIHDELHVHENAFKRMSNLRFLKFYTFGKEARLRLNESFDYLPSKLKIIVLGQISNEINLENLWEGVSPLGRLKKMDLWGSKNLKEIPDLSKATSLEKLDLKGCSSLVELPSSISKLNKLTELNMPACTNLETLPTGMNLESLNRLNLKGCTRLRTFPNLSRNISELILDETSITEFPSNLYLEHLNLFSMEGIKSEKLWERAQPLTPLMTMLSPSLRILSLSDILSLVELPSSFHNLHKLTNLSITRCKNLEILPTGINLPSLIRLILSGCSRLRSFPDISRNVLDLNLSQTGIEEIPLWVEDFSRLKYLFMESCPKLKYVSISTLRHLEMVDFSNCGALTGAGMIGYQSGEAMRPDDIETEVLVPEEASSSFQDNFVPRVKFRLINCFDLNLEALLQQQSVFEQLILSCEEVPSYFTHKAAGASTSLTVPLLQTSLSRQIFGLRACAVVVFDPIPTLGSVCVYIKVSCRFKDEHGNYFDSAYHQENITAYKKGSHMFIFDYCFPLNEDNAHLAKLSCDHVDIQFHFPSNVPCKLIEWGIRLIEDFSSPENQLFSPSTDEHNVADETDHGEECEVQGCFSFLNLFFAICQW